MSKWIVVLENEEGTNPTIIGFDSEDQAKAWAEAVNEAAEYVWPDWEIEPPWEAVSDE